MVNGIRTIYPCGLNKGFEWKLCMSRIRHEPPEEGRSIHQPKRCEYNKDEDNSPNTLDDKKVM